MRAYGLGILAPMMENQIEKNMDMTWKHGLCWGACGVETQNLAWPYVPYTLRIMVLQYIKPMQGF